MVYRTGGDIGNAGNGAENCIAGVIHSEDDPDSRNSPGLGCPLLPVAEAQAAEIRVCPPPLRMPSEEDYGMHVLMRADSRSRCGIDSGRSCLCAGEGRERRVTRCGGRDHGFAVRSK